MALTDEGMGTTMLMQPAYGAPYGNGGGFGFGGDFMSWILLILVLGGDWDGIAYEGGRMMSRRSRDGMSGARGRGSNAKRDRMGRYSSEGDYSRAEAKEEFMERVYELIDEAPDEHTRKKAERFANEIK